MTNQNTALITGASGGIGIELARIHASKGGDLVVVARSEDKLHQLRDELETKYGVKVWVIAEDLAKPDSALRIYDKTKALGLDINVLLTTLVLAAMVTSTNVNLPKTKR